MPTVKLASKTGTDAVKELRKQKLKKGLPFMINVKELSSNQCYLEYPDGTIKLITVVPVSNDITVVRELTTFEASVIRDRFHFSSVE